MINQNLGRGFTTDVNNWPTMSHCVHHPWSYPQREPCGSIWSQRQPKQGSFFPPSTTYPLADHRLIVDKHGNHVGHTRGSIAAHTTNAASSHGEAANIPDGVVEARVVPKKWSDVQSTADAYAFSATAGDWNFAPPIIIRCFTFGTLVKANPYRLIIKIQYINYKSLRLYILLLTIFLGNLIDTICITFSLSNRRIGKVFLILKTYPRLKTHECRRENRTLIVTNPLFD